MVQWWTSQHHVETATYLQLRLKNARAGLTVSTLLILATPLPAAKEEQWAACGDFGADNENPGRLAFHSFFFYIKFIEVTLVTKII